MGVSDISPLDPSRKVTSLEPLKPARKGGGEFAGLVSRFGKEINAAEERVGEQVRELAAGNLDNVHRVVTELGKAEITFSYLMEVRNKMIEAYKEVMRMQM